jgi:hypothetical protein
MTKQTLSDTIGSEKKDSSLLYHLPKKDQVAGAISN